MENDKKPKNFIKTTIREFLNEQKLNERTDYDDLFLGKKISDIKELIPNLNFDSMNGINHKTIVAMDSFNSENDAINTLQRNGWSVGRMQGDSPRGIKSDNYDIMKWRNLSTEDKEILDGILIEFENKYYIIYFTFPEF